MSDARSSSSPVRRLPLTMTAVVVPALLVASACGANGPGGDNEASADETDSILAQLPDYYPAEYADTIDACRDESSLVIYGSIASDDLTIMIAAFNQLYPFVSVQSADFGSNEVFETYYAEAATNQRTADVIESLAADGWSRFIDRGELAEYETVEQSQLPDFTTEVPYHLFSTDPYGIIVNPHALADGDTPPSSLGEVAALVSGNPEYYNGMITGYTAENAYARWWSLAQHSGETFWTDLETIGTAMRPETSGGTMAEKMLAEQYAVALYVPLSILDDAGILDWRPASDGTPIGHRATGITNAAQSPNCAKLWIDFVVSETGQKIVPELGRVPYRDDVADTVIGSGAYHYQTVIELIGEEQALQGTPGGTLLDDYDATTSRLNATFFGN